MSELLLMHGRVLVPGDVTGEALVSTEPLSFWGGYDHHTGEIIDRRHPLSGQRAAGRILALPAARGSSTTTAVLLEAIRKGTAPGALLIAQADPFLALASVVADEMGYTPLPVIALEPDDFATLQTGQWLCVLADGTIERITPRPLSAP